MDQVKIRIFEAISQLFREGGVEAVKLSAIAKICGMQKPSLLYHFSCKEEMLSAYYSYYLNTHDVEFFAEIDAYIKAHDRSPESFCGLIDFIVSASNSAPSLLDVMSEDIIYLASKQPAIHTLLERKLDKLEEFLRNRFASYLPYGILSEERFEHTCSDLLLVMSGIAFLKLSRMTLPGYDAPIKRQVVWLKNNFLK